MRAMIGMLSVVVSGVLFTGVTSTVAESQGRMPYRAAEQDSTQRRVPFRGTERDSMEARVQARMGMMLRNQLGMSDDQLRRFQETNRKFEGQRRALFEQEREVRTALIAALAATDTAKQQERVGTLLDRTMEVQRQRLQLLEAEQRELSTFLTPVQRARVFGMEEQIRRRTMEMREPPPRPMMPMMPRRPPGF
jgi:hypothetical protein